MTSTRSRVLLAGCGAVVVAAAVAVGTSARTLPSPAPYDRYTLSGRNVAIVGAPGARGFPRASIVIPRAWERVGRDAGTATFRTPSGACPFTVSFSVRLAAGPAAAAADHVALAVPSPGPRNVQDEGTRGRAAWRVVRLKAPAKGIDGRQAYATASGVIGLPAGQRAWMELVARARTSAAYECHAGHYRTVSRQVGDALAVSVR